MRDDDFALLRLVKGTERHGASVDHDSLQQGTLWWSAIFGRIEVKYSSLGVALRPENMKLVCMRDSEANLIGAKQGFHIIGHSARLGV